MEPTLTTIPNDVIEQLRLNALGQLEIVIDVTTLQPYLQIPNTKIRIYASEDFCEYRELLYYNNKYNKKGINVDILQ